MIGERGFPERMADPFPSLDELAISLAREFREVDVPGTLAELDGLACWLGGSRCSLLARLNGSGHDDAVGARPLPRRNPTRSSSGVRRAWLAAGEAARTRTPA